MLLLSAWTTSTPAHKRVRAFRSTLPRIGTPPALRLPSGPVLYVSPNGEVSAQAPEARPLTTFFAIQRRKRGQVRVGPPVAHIRVSAPINTSRLARQMGDALCQPADKFNGFLDIVPDGVTVCPRCAELAQRYDLPIPDNAEIALRVTDRHLRPDDPPVAYVLQSKWWNYNYGIPFDGYLRKWDWIRSHCKCAECEARIGFERGDERVLGMEIFDYYVCDAGHAIKDERDLRWRGRIGSQEQAQEPGPRIRTLTESLSVPF